MEDVSERPGALDLRKTAAIESVPPEILDQIFSHLPRNDRLATSRCSRGLRVFNQEFTWKSIDVDIGDSSEFVDRTERSKYLFGNLPHLYTTLLKYRHLGKYTVKLSLKISRYCTYEMMVNMKFLSLFSSLQELSLSPPPSHLELPLKPTSLRLDFHYDRSTFWQLSCYDTHTLNLEQYLWMSNLRKLQVDHISFEPEMHHDGFAGPQQISPIEDLRFIDCSPQTVGVLAKILLSVKCLKKLSLEMNIPRPVVEDFDSDSRRVDWHRPGGQDYGSAINAHAQSLEELIIAFSDGASFFIRPLNAAHPQAIVSQTGPIIPRSPLVPPINRFDKFTKLKRLAIPECLLARNGLGTMLLFELLPKLLEELQLQIPVAPKDQPLDLLRDEELRTTRMYALAREKDTCVPRLKMVTFWYQQYSSCSQADLNGELVYDSEVSWSVLEEAFGAVGVHLDRVSGPFFEDTPFGQPLNISHSRLRPPNLVQKGPFSRGPAQPGLYYDLSTHSIF